MNRFWRARGIICHRGIIYRSIPGAPSWKSCGTEAGPWNAMRSRCSWELDLRQLTKDSRYLWRWRRICKGVAFVWPRWKCSRPRPRAAIVSPLGIGATRRYPKGIRLHLEEISSQETLNAYAVVILDQPGGRTTDKLEILANITLLPLASRSLELNRVENTWHKLIKKPRKIMPTGPQNWAREVSSKQGW